MIFSGKSEDKCLFWVAALDYKQAREIKHLTTLNCSIGEDSTTSVVVEKKVLLAYDTTSK